MHPVSSGPLLDESACRAYRLGAVFECGKLDPQVGDTAVLAPFPLLLDRGVWRTLGTLAEAMAREALDSERALIARPDLHARLGLPGPIRRVLRGCDPQGAAAGPRIMRFDFHWARPGGTGADDDPRWLISEVNADVPGGFIEAGPLARQIASLIDCCAAGGTIEPPPDPSAALAAAIRGRSADRDGVVALVHATAFADDFQVMRRLCGCLSEVGLRAAMAAPDHLRRAGSGVVLEPTGEPIIAVVRYFPGEWLPELGRAARWSHVFVPTPDGPLLTNPGSALLIQSKRWPLAWNDLGIPLGVWRRCLPAVCDPRDIGQGPSPDWVLKPALGRVGEGVLIEGVEVRDSQRLRRLVRRLPRDWIAQRRFRSVPVATPIGNLHVCLGVYVVDGFAAGVYARAAARPLIDQGAYEIPVLIRDATVNARADVRSAALEAV